MDISTALAADLAALTDALGDPDVDLHLLLRALAADLKRAVSSYVGITMTVVVDGQAFTFSAAEDANAAAIATSLKIPLTALTTSEDGSSLFLYAATPGAFVDLAADLTYVLDIDADLLVLDDTIAWTDEQAGMTGFADYSMVNQATGVLIARGHTAESARRELRRIADLDGGHLREAADAILMTLTSSPNTDSD